MLKPSNLFNEHCNTSPTFSQSSPKFLHIVACHVGQLTAMLLKNDVIKVTSNKH